MDKSIGLEYTFDGCVWDTNGYLAQEHDKFVHTKGYFKAWHRAYNKLMKKGK